MNAGNQFRCRDFDNARNLKGAKISNCFLWREKILLNKIFGFQRICFHVLQFDFGSCRLFFDIFCKWFKNSRICLSDTLLLLFELGHGQRTILWLWPSCLHKKLLWFFLVLLVFSSILLYCRWASFTKRLIDRVNWNQWSFTTFSLNRFFLLQFWH